MRSSKLGAQIWLGNKENEVLVDLGNKRSYNYKGKPLTSEVYAEAHNEFATEKSDNVTVDDVMVDKEVGNEKND